MYSRHSTLSYFAQDPEASPEEIDELIARQFSAIESGLSDACPAVRAAVVSGLCQLLNDFWELIPAPVVAGNIKRLTSKAPATLTDDKHNLKSRPKQQLLLKERGWHYGGTIHRSN